MTEHYMDNSATTMVCKSAAEAAYEIMTQNYGNPSSLHSKGLAAERILEDSRETIAHALGVDAREIFFTSGGTESNNLAVLGAAHAKKRTGNRIITTAFEHSSVLEAAEELKKEGFEVIYIKPDRNGNIPVKSIENAINENTILVSIMAVNNEIGTVLPINCVAGIIKRKKSPALLHIDAVQAFGKIVVNPKKIGADLISVSSHKVHGPKGAGAIYIRRGVRLIPCAFGGEQERKIRPGTEPLPAIAGFASAVKEFDIKTNGEKVHKLNSYLSEKLLTIPEVVINSLENTFDYIINISTVGVKSETMLHFLAERGIYVSSGSACAKGKKSHVLTAMGLEPELADSALRISLSKYNTFADADALVEGIRDGLQTLIRSKK